MQSTRTALDSVLATAALVLGALFTGLFFTGPAGAQDAFDPDDPLRGDRLLARSVEIMALRADPVLLPRLYDARGEADPGFVCPPAQGSAFACDADGVGTERTAVLTPPTGYRGLGHSFDGVAADFDGDGREEFAYAYEATDGFAYLRVTDVDDGTLGTVSRAGVRGELPVRGPLRRRPIRVVAGEADGTPGLELILAYRADLAPGEPGTAVEYFDVDPTTLEPTRYDATSRRASLFPTAFCDGPPSFDPVFDIALADLDGNGVDEMVLAQLARACVGSSADDVIEVTARTGSRWLLFDTGAAARQWIQLHDVGNGYSRPHVWSGVALAVGDFDASDAGAEVAVLSQSTTLGNRAVRMTMIQSDDAFFFSTFGPENQLMSLRVLGAGADMRFDAEAFDLDRNGRPEIVTADGDDVRIFELGGDDRFVEGGIARVGPGTVVDIQETGLGRLMVGDLDASASTVVTPEIAVGNAWDLTIEIFRPTRNGFGDWSLALIDAPRLAHELNSPVTLVPIDVDDDSLFLGSPSSDTQTFETVFQPLVILNAPPVHFDVVDGATYDVNGCWDADGCAYLASYSVAMSTTEAVETEVGADWATSTEVRAGVGVEFGFVQASVEARLETEVGGGFSRLAGSSTTVTMEESTEASEFDMIWGTESVYRIIEYPVYAGQDTTTPLTHVVSVEPVGVTRIWRPSTDIPDLRVPQDHESGNLLSYEAIGDPFDNEAVEFDLEFAAGETVYGINGGSGYTWTLDFSQGSALDWTQSSQQSVSAGVDASVSAGAFGVTADLGVSVEGRYASGSVNTHRTSITTESSLSVTLADLDSSLTVNGEQNGNWVNYAVQPYAYWSYAGALVVDYSVDLPETTGFGEPSFWETLYGEAPDLAFSMPLRNQQAKTGVPQGLDLARRTRDILASPKRPTPGETVTIEARVQNYSLETANVPTVAFYLGDPAAGGLLLGVATPDPGVTSIPARGDVIVRLADWIPPSGITPDARLYAEIFDGPGPHAAEFRRGNNVAWTRAGFRSLPHCANGFDDDGDGDADFPEDLDCQDANGTSEVPEPGFSLALAVGALALRGLRQRRRPGRSGRA